MSGDYWICNEKFNLSDMIINVEPIPNTKRHNILYTYPTGITRKLALTVPRVEDAYMPISRPTKKSGKRADGSKFIPNKHTCTISMKHSNQYHVNLQETIKKVQSFLENTL